MRKLPYTIYFAAIIIIVLLPGCKRTGEKHSVPSKDSLYTMIQNVVDDTIIEHRKQILHVIDSIYGDTVWVKPMGVRSWQDTVESGDAIVYVSARIDSTDLIVDTVRSSKGGRIVMGYNHYYNLNFCRKNNQPWFSVSFNKKQDLEHLIGGTDFWLDSNLDVFRRILYDKKYGKYVVEFNINPRYDYGSVYYFVIDTDGNIDYTGTAGGWGGGDPDGTSFITKDEELYVSPFEVFSFKADTATGISDYAMLSEKRTYQDDATGFQWLHGLRSLKDNYFLVVFSREDNEPEYNALILKTDTMVACRFRYYGMMEEMDAILLFQHIPQKNSYYLYDSEQEVLITIPDDSVSMVLNRNIKDIRSVQGDTMSAKKYIPLSFDDFGNYRFYLSRKDTSVFFDKSNFGP